MHRFVGSMKIWTLLLCLALLLTACAQTAPETQPDPPKSSADETPEIPAEEAVDPVVFPAAGEMLAGDCLAFAPPKDDGSREITIEFVDLRSDGQSVEATWDLAATPMEENGAELILWRDNHLSSVIYKTGNPIREKADRDWVLSELADASFEPADEGLRAWSMVLYVEDDDGETEYRINVDGTLYRKMPEGAWEVAHQAVDYFGFSALSYKYADDPRETGGYYDGWFTEVTLQNYEEVPAEYAQWWDSSYPMPPADRYRLCLQSGDFHVELDREQATVMLRALFGESWTGGALMPSTRDFTAAEPDPTWGESCVCLTEYLIPLGTPYESYLKENEIFLQQTAYLYPDGTLVRVPNGTPGYHHYEYGIEFLAPSWQRYAVLENAFDPAVLDACLEGLLLIE